MDDPKPVYLTAAIVVSMLTAAWFLAMIYRAGRAMRSTGGAGIVPFELAESPREADRLMRTWGTTGRQAAWRSIHWDFAFIGSYVILLSAAGLYVAARARVADYGWLRSVEWIAVGMTVLTGSLDCVENGVLLRELRAHNALAEAPDRYQLTGAQQLAASRSQIGLARACAQMKFFLAGMIAITILAGFGITELSGHPTSTLTILTMTLAAALAAALFLLLRRATPPHETRPPDTTGLQAEQTVPAHGVDMGPILHG